MEAPVAILKGCQIRRDVKIDILPYVIGRCRTANFIIAHINVSRNHCHIVRENLLWKVIDYSSSGTYVNNELVGKKQSKVLHSGDVIRFGSVESNLCWKFHLLNEYVNESEQYESPLSETNAIKNAMNTNTLHTDNHHGGNKTIGAHQVLIKEAELRVLTMRNGFSPSLKHNESNCENKVQGYEKIITEPVKCGVGIVDSKLHKTKSIVQTERVHNKNEDVEFQMNSDSTQGKVKAKICENEASTAGENSGLQKEDLQNNSFVPEENENEKNEIKSYLQKPNVVENSLESLPQQSVNTNAIKEPCFSKNLSGVDEQENIDDDDKYTCLPKKARIETETDVKSEMEQSSSKNTDELLKELEKLKSALNDLEYKNSALEGELAAASSSKNEALEFKSNLLGNLTDLMEDELQCTICSELFVQAITLGCTHTFCKFCISQWRKKQKTCPMCRRKITSETRSLVVDNYIDKMVGNLSVELKKRRDALIAERNATLDQRKGQQQKGEASKTS